MTSLEFDFRVPEKNAHDDQGFGINTTLLKILHALKVLPGIPRSTFNFDAHVMMLLPLLPGRPKIL